MARSTPKLLTEEEAAERLRISPTQLARIRRAGGIGYVKVAQRSYRYTESLLAEYVRLCRIEPRLWVMIKDKDRRAREAAERRDARSRNGESSWDKPLRPLNQNGDTLGSGIFRRPRNF